REQEDQDRRPGEMLGVGARVERSPDETYTERSRSESGRGARTARQYDAVPVWRSAWTLGRRDRADDEPVVQQLTQRIGQVEARVAAPRRTARVLQIEIGRQRDPEGVRTRRDRPE